MNLHSKSASFVYTTSTPPLYNASHFSSPIVYNCSAHMLEEDTTLGATKTISPNISPVHTPSTQPVHVVLNNSCHITCIASETGVDQQSCVPLTSHNYILDSGATTHLTPYLNDLINVRSCYITITFANNESNICYYEGDINQFITDVKYLPAARKGLISVSLLDQQGCTTLHRNGKAYVMDNVQNLVVLANLTYGLYRVVKLYNSDAMLENGQLLSNKMARVGKESYAATPSSYPLHPLYDHLLFSV